MMATSKVKRPKKLIKKPISKPRNTSVSKKPMARSTASKPVVEENKTRKLKHPKYKSFKLTKRIKSPLAPIPSAYRLTRASLGTFKRNWRLFLGIIVCYGLVSLLLVRGFGSNLHLTQYKETLQFDDPTLKASALGTASTLFGYLISNSGGSVNQTAGTYQALLIIVIILVLIWTLRQVLAGIKINVRDAYYKSLYPMVPFLLVLLVIGLQMVPFIIGGWLYSVIVNGSLAANTLEKATVTVIAVLLFLLSLYMVCSSIFALIIVTLPDMYPIKALRSARQLVANRRWLVMRKVLFLPILIFIVIAILMMPFLLFATGVAEWAFFIISIFIPAVAVSYLYTLYRALL
jgi:hypothetical protein